ncbi:MAG: o-succinylbenzoate synthase [Deltaproteobacteria bacterium]
MIKLSWTKVDLLFKKPSGTSRGIITSKPSWILKLKDDQRPDRHFHGEVSVIPGLSYDNIFEIENFLNEVCNKVNNFQCIVEDIGFDGFPAVEFGYEMLKYDYLSKREKILFKSDFTEGRKSIPINGLIWMGDRRTMFAQVKDKIDYGWKCIKLKIGGIQFKDELELLKYIRKQYAQTDLEIRLDANGAFSSDDVINKLERLSDFGIHSIEQPVRQGQIELMSDLCRISPIPIALDEELIGISKLQDKKSIIERIKPHYIIIKPSLTGGFNKSEEWISIAADYHIGFWITSALESNIGLNAIAQWTATMNPGIPQGLGTGGLFTNNFESPLTLTGSELKYDKSKKWKLSI